MEVEVDTADAGSQGGGYESISFTTSVPDNFNTTETDEGFGFYMLIKVPTWSLMLLAMIMLGLCLICCIVVYLRACCCRGKKSKDKPVSDKSSLLAFQMQRKSAYSDCTTEPIYLGKLQYSLDYDLVKQELAVGVMQASDMPALDDNGLSDPYVKVFMVGETKKKHKTKICYKTLNPVFNEFFHFKIPFAHVKEKTLIFHIYDQNRFSKDEIIGQVKVALDSIDLGNAENAAEHWCDVNQPTMDTSDDVALGDICLTLQYIPSSGKLTISILECKNVKEVDLGELPNPYIKVEMVRNGKRVKKFKTEKLSGTVNPYFNESFTFDVMPDQLYLTSLVVWLMNRSSWIGQSVVVIGKLELSNNVLGSEYKQWSDMLKNPRRPIPSWHEFHTVYGK